ncbi:hypothetical protein LZ30DRAFT_604146 [Colletotrichum cereale]|nr:hypothetical protein LZ30DRAFT_604146 [Colletotrichum cereale]
MYFANIFAFLLSVSFTSQPRCYALPADPPHKGKPIQYVLYNLIAVYSVGTGVYYPQEHGHDGNVAVYNLAHCGNIKCPP